MLQESSSNKLGLARRLRGPEIELIRRLLIESGDNGKFLDQLSALNVQEMADGGMGSLYIVNATESPRERQMGQ